MAGGSRTSFLRRVAVDVRPLRYPDFRRLFVGQGVAFVGFQLTAVAVAVQMYDVTGSSLWVGLLGVAALVPLVVLGLYGGSVSDAVDRRTLLISASLAAWAVTGALFVQALLGDGDRWVLLVLVALQSAAFAMSSPTRGALVPRLLPLELVPAGNTLNFTMSNFGVGARSADRRRGAGARRLRLGVRRSTRRCSPPGSTPRCGCPRCDRSARRCGRGCGRCSPGLPSSEPGRSC